MSYHNPQSLNGGYDAGLLANAPAATRAERQEGYNVNLLNSGYSGQGHNRSTAQQPLVPSRASDPELVPASKEAYAHPSSRDLTPQGRAKPFWRTKKGIMVAAVAAVVIIGAVVGGAVGGTVGKKNGSGNNLATNTTATDSGSSLSASGISTNGSFSASTLGPTASDSTYGVAGSSLTSGSGGTSGTSTGNNEAPDSSTEYYSAIAASSTHGGTGGLVAVIGAAPNPTA